MLAQYALLVWMAQARGMLLGGFLKVIALAVLALLLAFVIGRSANFLKTAVTCFCVLPSAFFPSGVSAQWVRQSHAGPIVPDEPLRASLFQRPPPLYSL